MLNESRALATHCRVWVKSIPCLFGTSVFDTISKETTVSSGFHEFDRKYVFLKEEEGKIELYNGCLSSNHDDMIRVSFGRARTCPTTVVPTQIATKEQHQFVEKPCVGLAVVGLVWDSTREHLLVTQRPPYMRSFPGAWVFPGGGVEKGESLVQAVTREVSEETGLVTNGWNIFSLWESVYPTHSQPGVGIKAHHLVIYMSTVLHTDQELNLCDKEVSGAVWLSRDDIQFILNDHVSQSDSIDNAIIESNGKLITMHSNNKARQHSKIPLNNLLGIYPQQKHGASPSGMAQGSLFALKTIMSI